MWVPWDVGSLGRGVLGMGSLGRGVPGTWGPWVVGSLGCGVPGTWGPWNVGSLGCGVPGTWGPWNVGSLGHGLPPVECKPWDMGMEHGLLAHFHLALVTTFKSRTHTWQ